MAFLYHCRQDAGLNLSYNTSFQFRHSRLQLTAVQQSDTFAQVCLFFPVCLQCFKCNFTTFRKHNFIPILHTLRHSSTMLTRVSTKSNEQNGHKHLHYSSVNNFFFNKQRGMELTQITYERGMTFPLNKSLCL